MVQLKHTSPLDEFTINCDLNSIMVQLKHLKKAYEELGMTFQFHNGTIKTWWNYGNITEFNISIP